MFILMLFHEVPNDATIQQSSIEALDSCLAQADVFHAENTRN